MDLIFSVPEIFDDGKASTTLNTEGILTALPPSLVFSNTTNEQIISIATIQSIISLLSTKLVISKISGDQIISTSS